jgi:hypothetical protein
VASNGRHGRYVRQGHPCVWFPLMIALGRRMSAAIFAAILTCASSAVKTLGDRKRALAGFQMKVVFHPRRSQELPVRSACGWRNNCHLRALRALFGLVAFLDGTAPRIRKSSADLPPLIAAVNHFGLNPRPAHVSSGFCGLRYFGGTGPLTPNPEPAFRGVLPWNRWSFASSDSSARR